MTTRPRTLWASALCLAILVLLMNVLPGSLSATNWSTIGHEVVSDTSTASSFQPSIAVGDDGVVHVVWSDSSALLGAGTGSDIFYRSRTAAGWGTLELVSQDTNASSVRPQVVVAPNGSVHVAWEQSGNVLSSDADIDIFYRMRNADGWGAMEVVSTESDWNSVDPAMAVGPNGSVHVVWADGSDISFIGSTSDIVHKMRTADGWTDSTVVSTSLEDSLSADVAVDDDNVVYVVWNDEGDILSADDDWDVFLREFTDSWGPLTLISNGSANASQLASIAVTEAGTVHVVWQENTDKDSFIADDILHRSRLNGEWSAIQVVSEGCDGESSAPDIASYDDEVHVVWEDFSDILGSGGDLDVFYRVLSGDKWGLVSVVSTESDSSSDTPVIAVEDGKTHIVWADSSDFDLGAGVNVIYKATPDAEVSEQGFPYWILLLVVILVAVGYVAKRRLDENNELS